MARTASYVLDSVWKKVDVPSFDRSCFNFPSMYSLIKKIPFKFTSTKPFGLK